MKIVVSIFAVIVLSALNPAAAQNVPEKKTSAQWWFHSALADTIEQYLIHAEGQYSYASMSGATEGETQSGGARVAIRKAVVTHHTVYKIDKMTMSVQSLGTSYRTESQIFSDYLDVDLTPLLYAEAGFIWERDNTLLLKNRYSGYAGAGLNGMLFKTHYVNMLAALGRIDQNYTIPVDRINVVKGAYTAFYLRQMYQHSIAPGVLFMQQASYETNLNDTGRYRVSFGMSMSITIIEPLSLVLGYSYKYDREIALVGYPGKNVLVTIGFKVSL